MRTEENIAAVSANVYDDPQLSIRCRSQQLGLPRLLNKVENFAKELRCEDFQNTELKPNDLSQCRIFGEWARGKLAEHPLFIPIFIGKKVY